jgi:hypothetical protein
MGIAFTAQQQATRTKKSHTKPTECPYGLSDLFRLGSPSQGILGPEGQNETSIVQPNAHIARRPFPPGVAELGHLRTSRPEANDYARNHLVQPNAHMARATFSAWGRRARASSDRPANHSRPTECPHSSAAFSAWGRRARASSEQTSHQRPTECPYGSSDLFRLGSPSQGIFSFTRVITRTEGDADQQSLEPEGCPNGLGGFSAFNPPRPGRLNRVEGSGFTV